MRAAGAGTTGRLSTDAVFETLGSRRRRYALHYLKQVDESVTIRDLSMQLAAWENDVELAAVTPKQRKRVYTALHQTHLPKMDKLGVAVYDRDRGVVSLTDHVREFDVYLDVVPADDLSWGQVYVGLAAVLTALVSVAAVGVYPFDAVGGFGYALFVAVAFLAVGGYHAVHDRRTRLGTGGSPRSIDPPPERDGDAP